MKEFHLPKNKLQLFLLRLDLLQGMCSTIKYIPIMVNASINYRISEIYYKNAIMFKRFASERGELKIIVTHYVMLSIN